MDTRLVNPHDCQYVQSRVALDDDTVQQYTDMLRQEIVFDACKGVINSVTGVIIIYDGNHRAEAAKREGVFIQVELDDGNASYAEWLATGANTKHGLKRTPADIERAIRTALRHPRSIGKSDREIARHCGCDHKTVGKYRKELEASGERPQIPVKTVTRNGTEYQMTILMPKEPEPEPVRDPSPMVYDAHMHAAPKTEPILKGESLEPPVLHGRMGRCLDCGKTFAHSPDQTDVLFCPECSQAHLRERARGRDCIVQTQETEPEESDEGLQYCAGCGTVIEPGYEASYQGKVYQANCHLRIVHPETEAREEECDFCGQLFPISQLHFSPYDCEAICPQCTLTAMRAIVRYDDIAKPYRCPDCGYTFQAVAVKFYADDNTSGIDVP